MLNWYRKIPRERNRWHVLSNIDFESGQMSALPPGKGWLHDCTLKEPDATRYIFQSHRPFAMQVVDSSLEDIKRALDPRFSPKDIGNLDKVKKRVSSKILRDVECVYINICMLDLDSIANKNCAGL